MTTTNYVAQAGEKSGWDYPPEERMALFDQLPPSLRAALRDAIFDYSIHSTWETLMECGLSKTIHYIKKYEEKIMKGER